MLIILIFIFGLIIGSFINVIIYRLPRHISIISPGSRCPFCEHPLTFLNLIPGLSFFLQKGKCSYCGHPLSPVYPLVEGMAAIAFVLVYLQVGLSIELFAGWALTGILITAAFIDGQFGIIPDRLTYTAAVIALLFSFFTVGFVSGLIGMLFLGGLFFLVAFLSKGGMGGGDVKLAVSIGLMCGWPAAWWAFFLSSVLAAVYGAALLITGKADMKTAIRFGPFLAGGGFLAWLYSSIWFSGWGL